MTLDELLALLPDNNTGEIDAADLRTIVSELWGQVADVRGEQAAAGMTVDILRQQVEANAARISALEVGTTANLSVTGRWQVNPDAGAVPVAKQVSASAADWTAATYLRFNKLDLNDIDLTVALMNCKQIFGQQQMDASNWAFWAADPVTATDHGLYIEVAVNFAAGAGAVEAAGWQEGLFVLAVPQS